VQGGEVNGEEESSEEESGKESAEEAEMCSQDEGRQEMQEDGIWKVEVLQFAQEEIARHP